MRYLLHIGTNKTGTSTLQRYLGSNRDKLLQQGIWYPHIGSFPMAHHDYALGIRKKDFAERKVDPEIIRNPPPGTEVVLLSSEAFHTISSVEAVAEWFPPDQTQIVLYLREHVSYLASWYQQSAQERLMTCSFQEFAELFRRDFAGLVERWRKIYGDNVRVRPYDRERLRDGDIVKDFFWTAFRSEPPVERISPDANPSISGNLLLLKLILNHMITVEENERVIEEFGGLSQIDPRFGGRFAVAEREARRVAHLHIDDRKRLKQEYGIAFKPPREGIAGSLMPDRENLRADMERILAHSRALGFFVYDLIKDRRDLFFPFSG
jgi:hypothetical protein